MFVSIGEAANITEVPIRKLRYWEDKGFIQSVDEGLNKTRKFDYYQIKKIILIKELLDEGYTLEKAAEKVDIRIETLQKAFDKMERNQELE
ncbi:MerR family transcriptional regulator [Enterococcus faecalis]|uniref:MerR family transcriptional regulator n=1 Tax=Enterococcus faecalis TaxID=1351 RepID=UPI0040431886